MASSTDEVRYYHIDVPTGEIKTLAGIFPDDFDYVTVISEELKAQMQERMAEDPQEVYWLDNTKVEEWRFDRLPLTIISISTKRDRLLFLSINTRLGQVRPVLQNLF